MGRLHRMLILKACPYQQILSSKGAETTNGTASQHIHINKYVDLPDGSTIQIVDSGPLFTFLVIPKQQNGTRVLYTLAFKEYSTWWVFQALQICVFVCVFVISENQWIVGLMSFQKMYDSIGVTWSEMTYWTKEEGIFGAVYNGLMDGNEGTLRGPRELKNGKQFCCCWSFVEAKVIIICSMDFNENST